MIFLKINYTCVYVRVGLCDLHDEFLQAACTSKKLFWLYRSWYDKEFLISFLSFVREIVIVHGMHKVLWRCLLLRMRDIF